MPLLSSTALGTGCFHHSLTLHVRFSGGTLWPKLHSMSWRQARRGGECFLCGTLGRFFAQGSPRGVHGVREQVVGRSYRSSSPRTHINSRPSCRNAAALDQKVGAVQVERCRAKISRLPAKMHGAFWVSRFAIHGSRIDWMVVLDMYSSQPRLQGWRVGKHRLVSRTRPIS